MPPSVQNPPLLADYATGDQNPSELACEHDARVKYLGYVHGYDAQAVVDEDSW